MIIERDGDDLPEVEDRHPWTMRAVYKKCGGHYHVGIWSGHGQRAKCGDLTFREEEWPAALDALELVAEVLDGDRQPAV